MGKKKAKQIKSYLRPTHCGIAYEVQCAGGSKADVADRLAVPTTIISSWARSTVVFRPALAQGVRDREMARKAIIRQRAEFRYQKYLAESSRKNAEK
jgi:hypothetical protein